MKNVPETNRKVFAISFIVAIIAIMAFVGYVKYDNKIADVDKEVLVENPDPEKVFDAPFVKAKIYYIDLEKFVAPEGSAPGTISDPAAIGCGDGLTSYEVAINEPYGDTKSDATMFVLERLFNNIVFEQLKKESMSEDEKSGRDPYNALSKSKLRVLSIKEVPGEYEVRLSGTLSLGGVCDNPRAQAQLEKTIAQIFAPSTVEIFLNNKPLADVFKMK